MTTWMFKVFVFFLTLKVYEGSFPCKMNEYIIRNGSVPCLKCNDCPDGHGLKPACGSTLDHPPKIECVPCQSGTYSNTYDPSSCKGCHICSKHELVTKKCTPDSNTICSKTCETGWYYENTTHDCQPCSYCCGDNNDIIVQHCKPLKQHCSIHNALKCTPTTVATTANVTFLITTNKDGLDENKTSHINKILFPGVGVVVAIGIIVVLVYCYRNRRKGIRDKHHGERDPENGIAQPLNTCGFQKLNLCLKIMDLEGPFTTTLLFNEGMTLTLTLADSDNEDQCFKQCTFIWKKDGFTLNYEEDRQLEMKDIKVEDSGRFECQIHCQTHQTVKKCNNEIGIHVQPVQPKRLKLLNEIGYDMDQKLANLLKPKTQDVGNWQNVGEKYGMNKNTLKSLEGEDDRAEKVISHLNAVHTELTVFHFCEYLKTIKQFQIVKDFKKHLTVDETSGTSMDESRDSGVEFEEFSNTCLQVQLPPSESKSASAALPVSKLMKRTDLVKQHMINPSYSDSSREGSREGSLDEIPLVLQRLNKRDNDQRTNNQPTAGQNGKKKRKTSLNRQTSRESQRSAGTVSLSSLKDAIFKRNDYKEHKEEDTEEDEV